MDLSSLFGGGKSLANMAAAMNGGIGMDWTSGLSNLANGAVDLYGAAQGSNIASNVNQGVQQNLQQNNAATQAQIDALTQQIAQSRQQAQDMYQRSLGDVTTQNQGLQGNIDTLTGNLNALSDPNSAYMQQARQAIERKDAAAGRNSQWGDREVQLAGTLADYVGKYSPGLQSSITGARNQINQNNQGLANLYNQAQAVGDRESMTQLAALQQQLQNTTAMNTTGRAAQNSQNYNQTGAIKQGIQGAGNILGGLAGLFSGSDSVGNPLASYFQGQASEANGITGYGSGVGGLYGSGIGGIGQNFGSPMSAYDSYNGTIGSMSPSGYGNLAAGDYLGGGGIGGVPMSFGATGYQDTPNNIDDWSFWSDK